VAELHKLKHHVALAPSEEFLSADNPTGMFRVDPEQDTVKIMAGVSLDHFDTVVKNGMAQCDRYSTKLDEAVSVEIHKALPITRREASDPRLWAWLGAVHCPLFLAWRWKPVKRVDAPEQRSSERFVGNNVRQGIARLWWAAELTVDESNSYELTQNLLGLKGFQDGYEAMFGRAFCQYRPALSAFINKVGSENEKVIRETSKEFGYVLTTMVLESMNESEISDLLADLVQAVKGRLGTE